MREKKALTELRVEVLGLCDDGLVVRESERPAEVAAAVEAHGAEHDYVKGVGGVELLGFERGVSVLEVRLWSCRLTLGRCRRKKEGKKKKS